MRPRASYLSLRKQQLVMNVAKITGNKQPINVDLSERMHGLLSLCLEMCRSVYGDSADRYPIRRRGCCVMMHVLADAIVIAFAGSDSTTDWLMDSPVKRALFHSTWVHCGFLIRYNSVRYEVAQFLRARQALPVICCGYSVGGAVATLCALDIVLMGHTVTCVTFGSPRVGCGAFCHKVEHNVKSIRVAHIFDPVPHLPVRFSHPRAKYIGLHCCTLNPHSLQTYFSLLEVFTTSFCPLVLERGQCLA